MIEEKHKQHWVLSSSSSYFLPSSIFPFSSSLLPAIFLFVSLSLPTPPLPALSYSPSPLLLLSLATLLFLVPLHFSFPLFQFLLPKLQSCQCPQRTLLCDSLATGKMQMAIVTTEWVNITPKFFKDVKVFPLNTMNILPAQSP